MPPAWSDFRPYVLSPLSFPRSFAHPNLLLLSHNHSRPKRFSTHLRGQSLDAKTTIPYPFRPSDRFFPGEPLYDEPSDFRLFLKDLVDTTQNTEKGKGRELFKDLFSRAGPGCEETGSEKLVAIGLADGATETGVMVASEARADVIESRVDDDRTENDEARS